MPDSALVETWSLYGVGTLAIVGRTFCRWRMIGIHGFKFDDYMILLAWVSTAKEDGRNMQLTCA